MNIQITTTATLRSKILEITYKSFKEKILGELDPILFINIDCIGEDTVDDVLNIAKKYFTKVNYNIAETPNFCKAVKWLWSQTTSPYLFHLEDDWSFSGNFNLKHIWKILEKNPKLANLKLNRKEGMRLHIRDNEGTYKIYNEYRLLNLCPSLIRTDVTKWYSTRLDETKDPERQLRNENVIPEFRKFGSQWFYGEYSPLSGASCIDLGRPWREQKKIRKDTRGKWNYEI